jgi:hypothetical protein
VRTLTTQAQVKITLPDVIDALEVHREDIFSRRPSVTIDLHLELNDVVISMYGAPQMGTITIPRLVIKQISGQMLPVMDGDTMVVFKVAQE